MRPLMQPVTPLNAPALSIREMRRDDVSSVSELAVRVWRKHYAPDIVTAEQIEYMIPRICTEAAIVKSMAEKKHRYFLSFDGALLTGYIAIEMKEGGTCFIDKLYVDKSKQGLGIGEALLQYVVQTLRPTVLTLRVNRKNIQAINFYFKHGFMIESLDALDIGGGFVMDDFLMKKIL